MEKYKAKLNRYYTHYRRLGYKKERAIAETTRYLAVAEKYGVEFFAPLFKFRGQTNLLKEWIDEFKALGVKNFSFYNHCHAVGDVTACRIIGKCGREAIDPEMHTVNFYRVLSYDGMDVSTYLPQWRN